MEDELWTAILRGGVGTLALMILIMWLGKVGNVWVWAREKRDSDAAWQRILDRADLERERDQRAYEAQVVRLEAEIDREREEKREWRDVALPALGVAETIIGRGGDSPERRERAG